ncbi:MAG: hypothetical protein V3573_02005 [Desulfovibrionaceae bacterium]
MTLFRTIVSTLLGLVLLTGCAAVQGQGPEADALRRQYDESRTMAYPGVSVDKATKAAARLFELTEGGYGIVYGKGGVIAARQRQSFGDLTSLGGDEADYWYVSVTPSGDGSVVRVRRVLERDPNTSLDPADHRGKPGPLVAPETIDPAETWNEELTDTAAVYAIFFKRMDWLLGVNQYWLYCRAAEEYVKMEKLAGDLDPLCLDAADKRPSLR